MWRKRAFAQPLNRDARSPTKVRIRRRLDGAGSGIVLIAMSIIALGKIVATIYQMDFDIGDEDTKERVIKHAAERALAAYDSGKILELVSD